MVLRCELCKMMLFLVYTCYITRLPMSRSGPRQHLIQGLVGPRSAVVILIYAILHGTVQGKSLDALLHYADSPVNFAPEGFDYYE